MPAKKSKSSPPKRKPIAARAAAKRRPAPAAGQGRSVPVRADATLAAGSAPAAHLRVRGTAVLDAQGRILRLELEPDPAAGPPRRLTYREKVAEMAKDPRSRTWIQGLIGLAPGNETEEELLAKFKEWNG